MIIMPQPLRIDGSQREDCDASLYGRLVRDICFLYHELSAYNHIMGDLDYAGDYPLEYWQLLNRIDTGNPDDRFIRSGILILFLAMLFDCFDGSGDAISKNVDQISNALARFVPEDDAVLRLQNTVEHGLRLLTTTGRADDLFVTESSWAYTTFVRSYFAGRAT